MLVVLFADFRYVLPLMVLAALAALAATFAAAELVGALLAIVRSDHRNPLARWFTDWFEQRHP